MTAFLLLLALSSAPAPTVQQEIAAADAAMFGAFNAHDVDRLVSYFADDIEFYQDNEGLANKAKLREDFTHMFANAGTLRRDLVPGSLHVYPVPGYGAMEIGTHRFCHVENGKDDCGDFGFAMVWQKKDGAWRVTRVLSYGH